MERIKIWPEPKVVLIGGGSGTSTILSGIKNYTSKITAIIAVSDDGGSTGRLRKDLGIIAPGDIRNCLVALANTDKYIKDLFDYRFESGDLEGHSFGNIFLAAMNGVFNDFGKAIYQTGEILSITGKVLPLTLENTSLVARLENGQLIRGESLIPREAYRQKSRISQIFLEPNRVEILEDAKRDIEDADYIILGPGSLYTSIIPNLLAKDLVKLVEKSKARLIYIANQVTQKGETDGYTIKDHYDAIISHAGKKIIDEIFINRRIVDDDILLKYQAGGSDLLLAKASELEYFEKEGVKIVQDEFAVIVNGKIRHDADRLARLIFNII